MTKLCKLPALLFACTLTCLACALLYWRSRSRTRPSPSAGVRRNGAPSRPSAPASASGTTALPELAAEVALLWGDDLEASGRAHRHIEEATPEERARLLAIAMEAIRQARSPSAQRERVTSLWSFGWTAVPELVKILRSEADDSVRDKAASALGTIASMASLREAGREGALGVARRPQAEALLRQQALDALRVAAELGVSRAPRRIRDWGASAISAMGSFRSEDAARALIRLWADQSVRARYATTLLAAIGHVGHPLGLAVAEGALAESRTDGAVREAACFALMLLAGSGAVDDESKPRLRHLFREALDDVHVPVRRNACGGLGSIGEQADLGVLKSCAATDAAQQVRDAAALAVEEIARRLRGAERQGSDTGRVR